VRPAMVRSYRGLDVPAGHIVSVLVNTQWQRCRGKMQQKTDLSVALASAETTLRALVIARLTASEGCADELVGRAVVLLPLRRCPRLGLSEGSSVEIIWNWRGPETVTRRRCLCNVEGGERARMGQRRVSVIDPWQLRRLPGQPSL